MMQIKLEHSVFNKLSMAVQLFKVIIQKHTVFQAFLCPQTKKKHQYCKDITKDVKLAALILVK